MLNDPITAAQSLRGRAQRARQQAEATDSALEQSRLNKYADDLDRQADLVERQIASHPHRTRGQAHSS